MKLCLIASAGGHLTQLLQLENLWKKYSFFLITHKKPVTKNLRKKYKTYFIKDPLRNPIYFLINFFQSFLILIKEKPDIIITTGGGIAVALSYLGKLIGKKLIYIESLSRVRNPSLTGRLLYPIADLFLVQWKSLLKKYGNRAKYKGRVI